MATKLEITIERLSKQLKQAQSKQSLKLARERKEAAKKQRALETRRKILLGSFTDHLLKTDQQFAPIFMRHAASFFKRDNDRELLGLAPLKTQSTSATENTTPPAI